MEVSVRQLQQNVVCPISIVYTVILMQISDVDRLFEGGSNRSQTEGFHFDVRNLVRAATSRESQGGDAKEVLKHLAQKLEALCPRSGATLEQQRQYETTIKTFLEAVEPRKPLFIQAEYPLCRALFTLYSQEWGEPRKAADALARLHNYVNELNITEKEKAKLFIDAAQHYLVDEDDFRADAVVRSAKSNGFLELNDPLIQMQFKVLFAKTLESRREYSQAAMWYLIVSQSTQLEIPVDEIHEILRAGVICATLTPPGSNRSRLMAAFYRDSRTQGLSEYTMLQRLYLNQFIEPEEIQRFTKTLDDKKLAVGRME